MLSRWSIRHMRRRADAGEDRGRRENPAAMAARAEPASLTQLLLEETIQALGLPAGRLSRALIRPLVYRPANRFARLGVLFDRYMANGGFPAAPPPALA